MHLYLHIPFCDSKCPYCAFNSFAGEQDKVEGYFKALHRQLTYELAHCTQEISTVYIGGGTPSSVDSSYYPSLMERLLPLCANSAEITIEANPSSASLAWLQAVRNTGINRLSFGVQSFDDDKLQKLGRLHTGEKAKTAIRKAQEAGFSNLSIDLMYCLKDETFAIIEQDIATALALDISHISLYCLTEEPDTPFYRSGIAEDQESYGRQLWNQLQINGFQQYEVANFARNPTSKSQHNLGYWRYESYLGIGAGAVGCIGNRRYRPPENLAAYIENPLHYDEEQLTPEEQKIEKLFLGLRSETGIERSWAVSAQKIDDLLQTGKLTKSNDRLYCADYMLADEMALYLS